jgi:hypothetical protein
MQRTPPKVTEKFGLVTTAIYAAEINQLQSERAYFLVWVQTRRLVKGIFSAGESSPTHIGGKFFRRTLYLLAQVAIYLR